MQTKTPEDVELKGLSLAISDLKKNDPQKNEKLKFLYNFFQNPSFSIFKKVQYVVKSYLGI